MADNALYACEVHDILDPKSTPMYPSHHSCLLS